MAQRESFQTGPSWADIRDVLVDYQATWGGSVGVFLGAQKLASGKTLLCVRVASSSGTSVFTDGGQWGESGLWPTTQAATMPGYLLALLHRLDHKRTLAQAAAESQASF